MRSSSPRLIQRDVPRAGGAGPVRGFPTAGSVGRGAADGRQRAVTGGLALHGKTIHLSVTRHWKSGCTTVRGFV